MAEDAVRGQRGIALVIEGLEIILASVIAILVFFAGLEYLVKVVKVAVRGGVDKEFILYTLDTVLLLVLSIDILRTLLVAIFSRFLPIRIVIEAAMIAVLREIISIEVRHLDYRMIIALTISLIGLGMLWSMVYSREQKLRRADVSRRRVEGKEGERSS